MIYYGYYAYDSIISLSHALDYTLKQGRNPILFWSLNHRDYFANITKYNVNGKYLAQKLLFVHNNNKNQYLKHQY